MNPTTETVPLLRACAVRVPCSTSNLGAGFDSLGLAFARYLDVGYEPGDAPLQVRRISSSFSLSRFHPILKRSRPHYGIDYSASAGTPVRAVGDGTVVSADRSAGYGNVVEIRHRNGYTTRYAHLRGFASGIRRGVRVQQEDVIGYVGMTGLATGPHLHYEFRQNGRPVDPNSVQQLSGDPVPAARRAEFASLVDQHILAMNQLSPTVLLADASNPISSRASE